MGRCGSSSPELALLTLVSLWMQQPRCKVALASFELLIHGSRQAGMEGGGEGSGDLVTTAQASGILERTLVTQLWEGCWLDPPGASGSALHQIPERKHTEA